MEKARNIFERIWQDHVIADMDGGNELLMADRIVLHDLSGTYSFAILEQTGKTVLDPGIVFASPDHTLSSCPGRQHAETKESSLYVKPLREGCAKYGITLFDDGGPDQGIAHIVSIEQGLTIPGSLIVCGDSHTCTHGALGALAYGVGTNEVVHALATSCILISKPKVMQVKLTGRTGENVEPMDVMLYILSKYGTEVAKGYAVVYTGSYIYGLSVEQRMTICNLTIELGADTAIISPDKKVLDYIGGRKYAPREDVRDQFCKYAEQIAERPDDTYDKSIEEAVDRIPRMISWGINPSHAVPVNGTLPVPEDCSDEKIKKGWQKAFEYTGLTPGMSAADIPIDQVFIGSCANGSLSSLKIAAETVRGKKVKEGIRALVVPGSEKVKREAAALGLDRILTEAGFVYGEPGCSLCVGSNGESVPPRQRCISSTNRNFIGRQGPGSMTSMASVYTAAMTAVTGLAGQEN